MRLKTSAIQGRMDQMNSFKETHLGPPDIGLVQQFICTAAFLNSLLYPSLLKAD